MRCDPLATTGVDVNPGVLVVLATMCVLVGVAILLHRRRRPGRRNTAPAVLLSILALGATLIVTPAAPASAASSICVTVDDSLSVVQTSVMDGLAPGAAPRPIEGLVANHSDESTFVEAVSVEIVAVTPVAGAPVGACTASDYQVLNPVMPVGRTLPPGGSGTFAGASIGFVNLAANQDACRHAVVQLLYTANP